MTADAASNAADHPHAGDPVTPVPPWGSWLIALGGFTVLFAVYFTRALPPAGFAPGDPVGLAPAVNATGESRFDGALGAAVAIGLRQSAQFVVVPPLLDAADAAAGTPTTQRAARFRVAVALARTGGGYRVTATVVDSARVAALLSADETAPSADAVLPALDRALLRVRLTLGERRTEREALDRPIGAAASGSWPALAAYAEGVAHWAGGRSDSARDAWTRAVAADTSFALAIAALGAARIRSGDAAGGRKLLAEAVDRRHRLTDADRQRLRDAARRFDAVPPGP